MRPDGSVVWVIANMAFLRDEHGRPISWVGQFQDITERRRAEEQLRRQADHDPLTGLMNRRAFDRELHRHLGGDLGGDGGLRGLGARVAAAIRAMAPGSALGGSIGSATTDEVGRRADALLGAADSRMYAAKSGGR